MMIFPWGEDMDESVIDRHTAIFRLNPSATDIQA